MAWGRSYHGPRAASYVLTCLVATWRRAHVLTCFSCYVPSCYVLSGRGGRFASVPWAWPSALRRVLKSVGLGVPFRPGRTS
jgi:hypothetical protein